VDQRKEDAIAQLEIDAARSKIADAFQKFLKDLAHLEEEYGTGPVERELERITGYNAALFRDQDEPEAELFQEWLVPLIMGAGRLALGGLRTATALGGRFLRWGSGILSGGAKTAARGTRGARGAAGKAGKAGKGGKGKAGLFGGLAGGAAGFLGDIAHKSWDQDVKIDAVNPDTEPLNVKSEALEELIAKTLEAIENLTQAMTDTKKDLGGRLGDINRNQHELIGLETGLSGEEVAAQQGVMGDVTPAKAAKGKDKEASPKLRSIEGGAPEEPARPAFEERPV